MKLVKLAGAAVNQTPFAWENNKRNILNAIEEASAAHVSILCLPELCITGYGCEDDFFRPDLRQTAWNILIEILPHTRGMVVAVGIPLLHKNKIYNCSAVVVDCKIRGFVAKKALANDGIHYEARQFEQWPDNLVEHYEKDGLSYPLGDIYFKVDDLLIGFEICEEAWIGKREGAQLTGKAVDIILNPSASHFSFGKIRTRKRLVLEGSRAFGAAYVYANLVGNEAGRVIYDGGTLIAQGGELVAVGKRFSYRDHLLTMGVVDIEHTRMTQSRTTSYKPEITGHEDNQCVHVPSFLFPSIRPEMQPRVEEESWETGSRAKEEEFARAIALGLFDYNRKSKANGFVLSLSGGADSTAVACLVKLMVDLAVEDLGLAGLKAKMSHIEGLDRLKDNRELIGRLLICAYQGTAQSGATTRNAAKKVADAIGARYFYFQIEPVVKLLIKIAATAIGRELTWEEDDITLQNVQARARAPLVWMLANIYGALLLSTSNRSEGAVGYCTMDGDTAGGLSPIAGIDKCFLMSWLSWLEQEGPTGLKPIKELASVTKQVPTAELRPAERAQTDEGDLMPYDLLNAIEDEAIENNRSPIECYQLMRVAFPGYAAEQMAEWVERFFHLWSINQWKRERLAPALHCDTRNLDPRTWRRSPILSGRFELEIKSMWEYAVKYDHIKDKRAQSSSKAPERLSLHAGGRSFKRALIVVDPQLDFMPGGALAVPDGDQIVPVINRLTTSEQYDLIVATQDWHPADHGSFAVNHEGVQPYEKIDLFGVEQIAWPVHCVQGSKGAEFHPGLELSAVARIFQKGQDHTVDGYSGFYDNGRRHSTGLAEFLRREGVTHVDVVGLALGYCVSWTALDAKAEGFIVRVVEDATRAIVMTDGDSLKYNRALSEAGIEAVSSEAVLAVPV